MKVKDEIKNVMREFYSNGLPNVIYDRKVAFPDYLGNASIIKGMRRAGKTFVTFSRIRRLLKQGVPMEAIVRLNFEDDRIRDISLRDLRYVNEIHAEFYQADKNKEVWYFLDEIQNVEGWEAYVRRLLDYGNVHVCITGSSSKMLSEDIATQMRGRSLPLEIFPLSFQEYLEFNGILDIKPSLGLTPEERGLLKKSIEDYLNIGGFPEIQKREPLHRNQTLQEYLDAIIYRDILERHQIASLQSFQHVLKYVLHNFGRKISIRAICGSLQDSGFGIRREDIAEYLAYFKDSYLAYPVSIRSDSFNVKRVNPEKYYLVDTGLINAVCPKIMIEKGMLLENLVYMSLRRGTNTVEYYVTKDNSEVDFHVYDNVTGNFKLVQVSYDISSPKTLEREIKALKSARKETGIEDCTLITWDEDEKTLDGIRIVPAYKWLLEQ